MIFRIFNDNFEAVDILENYQSMIWTTRFYETGDFELYTPVNTKLLNTMRTGYYIFSDVFYDNKTDQADLMIINSIVIENKGEDGNDVKITGYDLKSILNYRIVWGQRSFKTSDDETVKTVITALLNENLVNPSNWTKTYQDSINGDITVIATGENRKISNFEFTFADEEWEKIEEDIQFNGETLYEIIKTLCEKYHFGYTVKYDFTEEKFKMFLYHRRDKSYDQTKYPPIIFSPKFENIKSSNYIESSANEKTTALIAGEGDEYNVMYNVIGDDKAGLKRKELGYSASDVTRTSDDGTEYGNKTYLQMLLDKGQKALKKKENSYIKAYEGEVEDISGYRYKIDYDVGDICEMVNEYDIESKTVILEVVLSISTNGRTLLPTFLSIDDEDEDE